MNRPKLYIGDGVYVKSDGYGLILTAENGMSVSNRIYLEPAVFKTLSDYANNLIGKEQNEPR